MDMLEVKLRCANVAPTQNNTHLLLKRWPPILNSYMPRKNRNLGHRSRGDLKPGMPVLRRPTDSHTTDLMGSLKDAAQKLAEERPRVRIASAGNSHESDREEFLLGGDSVDIIGLIL
jgi:hypothetical protein